MASTFPIMTCVDCGFSLPDDGLPRLSEVAHDDLCGGRMDFDFPALSAEQVAQHERWDDARAGMRPEPRWLQWTRANNAGKALSTEPWL